MAGVWPKPEEVAVLIVNGMEFRDWETVQVRKALREQPPYHCRFTCSEALPLAKNFAVLQIMPGMSCTVTLAGQLAFTGTVETRQVYYDANRHHIEIICATFVDVGTSSVIHPTMEWKNKTFKQIADEVLKSVGVKLTFEGPEPSYKFPRVSATPGESIHDFLDVLARSLSQTASGTGISFTSNKEGDFVVATGPLGGEGDSVVEGKDILIGQEIIYRPSAAGYKPAISQGPGSDQKYGADVAQPFHQEGQGQQGGLGFGTAPAVIRNEMATSDTSMLQGRAGSETKWQDGDKVTVIVTVYGWLRPSGGLWRRLQTVSVTSPMLVMNGDQLIAKTVTFTQNDATGTRTQLELCNKAALGAVPTEIK